jgi:transcriptional regulator GlxA family with amidase domain
MAKADSPKRDARCARVGVFTYDGCSAWVAAGLLELFGIANIARAALPAAHAGGARRFECHVLGRKRRVLASQGVKFDTQAPAHRYDAVIVPSLWGATREEFFGRLEGFGAEHAPLRALAGSSHVMASACSGAVLLAGAGLLAGRRITTCWWLADWFRQRFAGVDLVLDRVLMADGDRWTAAAGSAYMHLGLELVRALSGEAVAAGTARLMLVERRRGSQSPFLAQPLPPRDVIDPLTQSALRYLDEQMATPLTIARLCRAIGVHERTLARRFQAVIGLSPLSYLQSRRVARARELLESSALPLEEIVVQCGYEDVASFRKLFARQVGMTPREYRSRFASDGSRG